jgi:KUP system potassium uptake protein
LLLAYIGQAAYISVDPTAANNPFFKTVPPGMIYPSLVVSILAAIVASQAMITSTFQLLSQVMKLSYFPHIKLVHTSRKFYGQIYIPLANWLLLIGTLVVTGVYSNTTRIGNAYGVCVILVTSITTWMVCLVALIVWRLNIFIVLAGFLVFGCLDGVYLSSALTKIPSGAWFTLVLAAILSSVFILWRYGKEQQWKAESHNRSDPRDFITSNEEGSLSLTKAFGGTKLTQTKGMGVFFDKSGSGKIPTVFLEFVLKFEAYPEIMVFFHMQPLQIPVVDPEERFTVSRTSIPNAFRFSIRHGYTEDVVTPDLGHLIYTYLERFIHEKPYTRISDVAIFAKASEAVESTTGTSSPLSAPESSELGTLHHAFETQVVYIVGKEQMRISHNANFVKRFILATYLWIRENTRAKVAEMHIPINRLVEVGFVKDL